MLILFENSASSVIPAKAGTQLRPENSNKISINTY